MCVYNYNFRMFSEEYHVKVLSVLYRVCGQRVDSYNSKNSIIKYFHSGPKMYAHKTSAKFDYD